MIGTITHILAKAGYKAMNGPLADERRRLAGAVPPAAYVSYDPRMLAGAGWYGYRIALKGGDRSMVERARYMLSERYTIRDSYEYYADGIYTFGVLLRQRVKLYGIGGGSQPEPSPDDFWGLKLKMPEGGTVILRKEGSPNAVSLEVSTDGTNWEPWELVGTDYSYTLQAGETLCIRNTSETAVGLSVGMNDYYNFILSSDTIAKGKLISLLIKEESDISLSAMPYCFRYIFKSCKNLLSMPSLIGITRYGTASFLSAFYNCSSLEETSILPNAISGPEALRGMFEYCFKLKVVKTNMTDISANFFINNWLSSVSATGDFYCPSSLTIPSGASGIPTGWTRHDI